MSASTERIIAAQMEETSGSQPSPKGKPVIGPALRVAGRTLRRVGEGLEGWARLLVGWTRPMRRARRPPG